MKPLEGEGEGSETSGSTLGSYFPDRVWKARLAYHGVFFPNDNLEVRADLGVNGRDRMFVPPLASPDGGAPLALATDGVPFYQSWYMRLQIRVVTVRIFITWENLQPRNVNQDFPGRLLPASRALYGIRWTLWN